MNTRDRLAWEQHLAGQLPELLPESTAAASKTIVLPGVLPSKANLHEIHFDPTLWRQIELIVQLWRKKNPKQSPYWISPSAAVKSYEEAAAYQIRAQQKERFTGGLGLTIGLFGQRVDVDAIKAVPDAIQQAGVIKNDNQFRSLLVVKHEAEEPSVELTIHRRRKTL
jgi:Holliday junction resolvase RusA-like endonuclease